MISSNIGGIAAYAAVQSASLQGTAAQGVAAPASASGSSFGGVLDDALSNLGELGRDADAKSVEALSGGGKLTDVVMAVSKAEMALQASIAVRDKVISAYQDIMRMAV